MKTYIIDMLSKYSHNTVTEMAVTCFRNNAIFTFEYCAGELNVKKTCLILILCFFSIASVADLPQRGALMESIENEFGAPLTIVPAVGEPPITRWLYENFTVIFEYDHVVHAFNRNRTVENLSQQNKIDTNAATEINETSPLDALAIPDVSTLEAPLAENEYTTPEAQDEPEIIPFSDEEPISSGSFFENTPDIINR